MSRLSIHPRTTLAPVHGAKAIKKKKPFSVFVVLGVFLSGWEAMGSVLPLTREGIPDLGEDPEHFRPGMDAFCQRSVPADYEGC